MIRVFLMVGIANILDVHVIGTGSVLRTAAIFFYISNEGISLLENASHLGLPVPKKVILVDIDETTFENDENKRLFYVGSSRAKLNLDLIVNGDESTIATIVDQLDFEPKKKPIAAIVKALDLKYNPEK